MAYEIPILSVTLEAAADLSAKQFYFAKADGTGKAALCSAAGEAVTGIIQNDPASGEAASVMVAGVSKVVFGGTVDEGDLVKTDANGKAVTATKATVDTSDTGAAADALSGSYVIAICLEGGASGETGTVLITHAGAVATTAA